MSFPRVAALTLMNVFVWLNDCRWALSPTQEADKDRSQWETEKVLSPRVPGLMLTWHQHG